jgi:anti-sigma B factor antagonist
MTIEIRNMGAATVIEICGRLDTTTAPALDKTINEDISENSDLTLDLKRMEYISSAGLRVLLSAQKRMKKSGSMKLKNVCEEVMDVFEMTGFADILEFE